MLLHYAATQDHKSAVEGLLKAGTDSHRTDVCGYTALHIAAINGHHYIVEMLLHAMGGIVKPPDLILTRLHLAPIWVAKRLFLCF
jgi:hypothetical protein